MQETMLTPEEVAQRLKVTERTVYRWLQSGRLRGYKLGARLWRIEPPDLRRFLDDRANDESRRADFLQLLEGVRSRVPEDVTEEQLEPIAEAAVHRARERIRARGD